MSAAGAPTSRRAWTDLGAAGPGLLSVGSSGSTAPAPVEPRSAHGGRVAQDGEGLLQGVDLGLAPALPLLEGRPDIVTRGAQVLQVLGGLLQLLHVHLHLCLVV